MVERYQLSADRLDPPGKLRRQRVAHPPLNGQALVGELITENEHCHPR